MLRIVAELEKGNRDRLLPITPDFADFLLAMPQAERKGRVFKPMAAEGIASYDVAGRILSLIGEFAAVKVHTHPKTGKVKYASAHDLVDLSAIGGPRGHAGGTAKLMRHESIETTMGYYVDLDANELAEDLYRNRQEGTVLGTVADRLPPARKTKPERKPPK